MIGTVRRVCRGAEGKHPRSNHRLTCSACTELRGLQVEFVLFPARETEARLHFPAFMAVD